MVEYILLGLFLFIFVVSTGYFLNKNTLRNKQVVDELEDKLYEELEKLKEELKAKPKPKRVYNNKKQ